MQWAGSDSFGVMMQKNSNQKDGLVRMVYSGKKSLSSLLHSRLVDVFSVKFQLMNHASSASSLLALLANV